MKNLSLLLSVAILLSACSKTEETTKYVNLAPSNEPMKTQLGQKTSEVDALKGLLNSDAPNLALAELLAKGLPQKQKEELKLLLSSLTADEAKSIIESVERDNKKVRDNYLFHGQVYGKSEAFLNSTLVDVNSMGNRPFSLETQLRVSAVGYLKSKSLNDLLSTYSKRVEELNQELAHSIALEIAEKHQSLAKEIEGKLNSASSLGEKIEFIRKAKPVVEKIDQYFKTSELSEAEQYTVVIAGALASGIYTQLQTYHGFQNLLKESKKVIKDLNEFKEKAQEFTCLLSSLEKHTLETVKNTNDLSTGLRDSKNDLFDLYGHIRTGRNGVSDVESKKIVEFLYKRVLKGEPSNRDGSNPSILSKKISFNKNFEKTVQAASSLTNNLTGILETTEKFRKFFKMRPSKDLQKAIDTARKVSDVVQTVQAGMAGFATGGYVGAISAICSGPMMSMMGGGNSKDSAMLSEISRKLDIVLEQQQKMLEMQMETMSMIKDLALMIDMYHQKEMMALAELRGIVLVNNELAKAQLNKDIRSCERITNFQLSSVWKDMNFGKEAFFSINQIDMVSSRFHSSIKSLNDIRRIVDSVEEDGFKSCQSGIADAFGGNNTEENPIRGIFSSTSDSNLYAFQTETYSPLVNYLYKTAGTTYLDSVPLHLPVKNTAAVRAKSFHIRQARLANAGNDHYDLEQLLSSRNLERYLGHLMVLLPFLEVDKSTWQKSYEEIVTKYLSHSNSGNNQNMRGYFFLTNALKLTQSAIAQEAILAGEPMLSDLYGEMRNVLSIQNCSEFLTDVGSEYPAMCSIRENKLLMKNLLMYYLKMELNDSLEAEALYEEAFKKGDTTYLAKLLKNMAGSDRFSVLKDSDNQVTEISVQVFDRENKKVAVKLPAPEALRDGGLIYSENMPRLMKMQEVILNGLEKVTPVKRDIPDQDLLKVLMAAA